MEMAAPEIEMAGGDPGKRQRRRWLWQRRPTIVETGGVRRLWRLAATGDCGDRRHPATVETGGVRRQRRPATSGDGGERKNMLLTCCVIIRTLISLLFYFIFLLNKLEQSLRAFLSLTINFRMTNYT
ncbi:unnamed protein product [Cuscuta europaea]|uniref:Uncharacterized protein n=1 Tax=Cuscuta europaea TaxID=41803 RepID=A0A9P0Z812_CUSEU|nr:unnamed protein product [Cuscuta europaea]